MFSRGYFVGPKFFSPGYFVRPKKVSPGYFVGPTFFLVGISWVPNFFLMGISWVPNFFSWVILVFSVVDRMRKSSIAKYLRLRILFQIDCEFCLHQKSTSSIKLLMLLRSISLYYTFFCKQLGSGLSPQNCVCFQGFWGSKLLNGCLVVWPSIYISEEYSNFQDSKLIFMIVDFKISPVMLLRQLNFGVL